MSKLQRPLDALRADVERFIRLKHRLEWALTESRDARRRKLASEIYSLASSLQDCDGGGIPSILVGLFHVSLDDWERRYGPMVKSTRRGDGE